MDDAIADDVGRRDEPVVIGGRSDVLPDRQRELSEHRTLDPSKVVVV